VARRRAAIEAAGTQVAFVHMSTESEASGWFDRYGLADVVRISDPSKTLYRQFDLEQGSLIELAHPRVWWPWIRTAILGGYGAGLAGPNWRQLTGAFVIHGGHIIAIPLPTPTTWPSRTRAVAHRPRMEHECRVAARS
jgi:hypothetical protein